MESHKRWEAVKDHDHPQPKGSQQKERKSNSTNCYLTRWKTRETNLLFEIQ